MEMSNLLSVRSDIQRGQKCPVLLNSLFLSAAMLVLASVNALGQFSLSASTLNFGGQTVETNSSPQTIFLTSTASVPISVTIAVTGDFNGDFFQTNTCVNLFP